MKEETGHIEPACDAHPADAAATDGGAPSASHTPGPWRVEQDGLPEMRNVGTYVVAGHRLDGALIADINTSMADARLIAAAPDLHATTKAWIDYLDAPDWLAEDAHLTERRLLDAMRAAIAKAEGHSQAGTAEQSAAPGGRNP